VKAQAVLWYLAAEPERVFSRAHLADLLWDSENETDRRNSLNTTLNRLRRALPFWPLRSERDTLAWDPATPVEVDAVLFRGLVRGDYSPEPAGGRTLVLRERLATAAAMWRGPLLADFHVPDETGYDQWLEQARPMYQRLITDALSRLVQMDEAFGDWTAMAAHARQALTIDPLQEHFHRALMTAHYQASDRAAALAQYEACREILARELNVDPDPATMAVQKAITSGRLMRTALAAAGLRIAKEGAAPAPGRMCDAAPPLVGREKELDRLAEALSAAAGERPLVWLHGEAGVGKTRLVQHVRMHISADKTGGTVLIGHCYEDSQSLPYAPLLQALEDALGRVDVQRLALPGWVLAEIARLVPEVAQLCPNLPVPALLSQGQERRRLQTGIARFLTALPGPVTLILEDTHWADEDTLSLLAYLIRQPTFRGLTILATARAGDLAEQTERSVRQLQREGLATWIDLDPLSPDAIQDLVTALTDIPDRDLGRRVYAETLGIPLFAVELLRLYQETRDHPGSAAGPSRAIPTTVQAVVLGRLARLAPAARELAAAAAVFPRGVPFPVLRRVAGLSEDDALMGVETLVKARFLAEQDASAALAFGHDLIRRTVLDSLSRLRQQSLHQRAFRYLTEWLGQDVPPVQAEQLAYHAVAGGLWQEGLDWSQAAADRARRLFAHASTVRLLEQALACLDHLPASSDLRRRAIQVRLQLCQVSFFNGPERLREWAEPAIQDAADLGDETALAHLRLVKAELLCHEGRPREALDWLEEVAAHARSAGDEALLARCLRTQVRTHTQVGDFRVAIRLAREAIPLLERHGTPLDVVYMNGIVGVCMATLGELDEAEAIIRPLVRYCQEVGDRAALADTLGILAIAAYLHENWQEAAALGRQGIAEAREAGHPGEALMAGVFLGPALAYLGDPGEGVRVQEETLALARRLNTHFLVGYAYAALGEALLVAGDAERAVEAAETGLATAEAGGAEMEAICCLREMGKARAAAGHEADARQILADALRRAEKIGSLPEMARCHAALVGITDGALQAHHIREARGLLGRLGMQWDLERLPASPAES
jgi:DNA-binding SARP family transcriptional activator/tetratricopeptide (TPR) repeat protein